MRFGIIFDFVNPGPWRRRTPEVYAEGLELAEAVEALGYDSLWLTEHHFTADENAPSSLSLAAAIAARTRRIRIGTWALLLPLHEPLRVAEDALVVDQIADGRFELGVVAGYRVEEFRGFGVSRAERARRMDEGLAVLQKAFHGERFSFRGEFHSYEDVRVTPGPSRGVLTLYSGGQAVGPCVRAARHRCHFLPSGPFVQPLWDAYAAELCRGGEDPAAYDMVGYFPWFVSEDPERTAALLEPHLAYRTNIYRRWYANAADTGGGAKFADTALVARSDPAVSGIVGTPDQIEAAVREFCSRAPYTEVISWASPLGAPREVAEESLRLFAETVLPRLRDLERASIAVPQR